MRAYSTTVRGSLHWMVILFRKSTFSSILAAPSYQVGSATRKSPAASTARAPASSCSSRLWNRRDVSLHTTIRVYQVMVRTILLYGCEPWSLRVDELRRIEVFDTWCRSRILRISPLAHVTLAAIHERCAVKAISDVLLQNPLGWFGHICRRPENALTSSVLNPRPCP